jgi:predicted ATPase
MNQPKITLNQLKQYLKTISQKESNTDITELLKRFPAVKEYYQIKLYLQAEAKVLGGNAEFGKYCMLSPKLNL